MATKQFYATRDFKYKTRMLKAGEPVEIPGPEARLYVAMGHVTDEAPRPVRAMATSTVEKPAAEEAPQAETPKARKPRRKKAK